MDLLTLQTFPIFTALLKVREFFKSLVICLIHLKWGKITHSSKTWLSDFFSLTGSCLKEVKCVYFAISILMEKYPLYFITPVSKIVIK